MWNETIVGIVASAITAVIMRTVDSYLKRGETKIADELAKEKLEHEQEVQLRLELRQEIKELRERVSTAETNNQELRRKIIELEKDVALKDAQIAILQNQVSLLQSELDGFRKKVWYDPRKGEKAE